MHRMIRSSLILGCVILGSCGIHKPVVRYRDPVSVDALRRQELELSSESTRHRDKLHEQNEDNFKAINILKNQQRK